MNVKFHRLLIILSLAVCALTACVNQDSLCKPVPAYQVWLLKLKPTPVVDAPFSIPTQDPAKPTPIGLCDPTIHYTLPGTPTGAPTGTPTP